MKPTNSQKAFTLIEMAVVMAIIAIISAIAVSNILSSRPRILVRGNVWDVNQILLNARTRAISDNQNYGVAFFRQGNASPYTYYYFVFKDANGDSMFTDIDGDPLHQCEAIGDILVGSGGVPCTYGGEDPIVGELYSLDRRNFFRDIFGTTLTNSVIAVVFQAPLGIPRCPNLNCGEIQIQSYTPRDFKKSPPSSYMGRILLNPATGTTTRVPPQLAQLPP